VPTTSTTSGYFSLLPDELLIKILSFLTEQVCCDLSLTLSLSSFMVVWFALAKLRSVQA
jgi:hypothetical protein